MLGLPKENKEPASIYPKLQQGKRLTEDMALLKKKLAGT
jgi:uncharacterized coiled-coil DUF342 family protein